MASRPLNIFPPAAAEEKLPAFEPIVTIIGKIRD
jgi:hypothetical protein